MSEYNYATSNITREEAIEILWRKGNLTYLLDSNQKELYSAFHNSKEVVTVIASSRQIGKSYLMCLIAIETCLKNKNAVVKFLFPKQKDAKTNMRPIIRQITEECPEDIRPVEKIASGVYYFPSTGSEIQFAGCDNGRAESVRGGKALLCIIDEAGFCSDLEYIVNSILLPTTTTTRGRILLASTPPKSASHEFVKFVRTAEYNNTLIKKTIFDNPRLTEDDIDRLARAAGGKDSINFKREYLAQIITDDTAAVVPEFAASDELQARIIREWPKPSFYDGYVAMDLGLKDLTVVLFAYYDFRANKVIVEDEYVINGQKFTTSKLAEGIREKESIIYADPFTHEVKSPYLRVSDNNLIVINDLQQLHGLNFLPTRKDDSEAALNNMRMLLAEEKIIINPRCQTLIRHLRDATWNKSRKSYDRSPDNGHFDAVDALKYLIRNIQFSKNPYPKNYGLPSGFDSFNVSRNNSNIDGSIKKILNLKKD